MSTTLAQCLREEIARLAKKELRKGTEGLRKQSAQQRRDIAELKRRVKDLEKKVAAFEREERKRVGRKPSPELAEGARFSAARLRGHRSKLGLSARDYAKLVGVSSLTIYNWEHGKTRPRKEQLAALVSIRGLGKRAAQERLRLLEDAS